MNLLSKLFPSWAKHKEPAIEWQARPFDDITVKATITIELREDDEYWQILKWWVPGHDEPYIYETNQNLFENPSLLTFIIDSCETGNT